MNMFSVDFQKRRLRKNKRRFIKLKKSPKKRKRRSKPISSNRFDKVEDT